MIKTYIAGKITGLDNYKALFDAAKIELKKLGPYEPVSPIELPHNHDKIWESYMKECIVALMGCRAIYLLKNFRESKGAMIEFQLATDLGYTIIYQ